MSFLWIQIIIIIIILGKKLNVIHYGTKFKARNKMIKLKPYMRSKSTIEIGRSKIVIANFLKDFDAYGTKEHTDWRKKISLALGRQIRRNVRKSSS